MKYASFVSLALARIYSIISSFFSSVDALISWSIAYRCMTITDIERTWFSSSSVCCPRSLSSLIMILASSVFLSLRGTSTSYFCPKSLISPSVELLKRTGLNLLGERPSILP